MVEGFGMGVDMLVETFKFNPGDWLIISNDATGLKNSPIHIHSNDTNDRIKEFFESGQVGSENSAQPVENVQEEDDDEYEWASGLDRKLGKANLSVEDLQSVDKVAESIGEYGGKIVGKQYRKMIREGMTLDSLPEVVYDHVFEAVAMAENEYGRREVWVRVARYLGGVYAEVHRILGEFPEYSRSWKHINIDNIRDVGSFESGDRERLRRLMEFIQVENENEWFDRVSEGVEKGDQYPIPGFVAIWQY